MTRDVKNFPLADFPWEGPAVLLVDLDAFFASVEQLDHPGWRGKPVIVGGDPDKRGVVATASYEARSYGVHSAMPSSTAARLCPDAIWTHGHFDRYRELSDQVMAILFDETPHVQQVSIDEAFLDVTPTKINTESPIAIAQRIQERVAQLGVTCSIGVGTSKAIAKMASDMDKPRGLTVVLPGSEYNFIQQMPLRNLSGIGPSTERKLLQMGIQTLGELHDADDERIVNALGKVGEMILDRVRGRNSGPIEPDTTVKSVSSETSFAVSSETRQDILAAIDIMAAKVGRRLRRKGLRGRTLTLKVRYENLRSRSTQVQLKQPSDDEYVFCEFLHTMLDELWTEGVLIRLVGVAVSGFDAVEEGGAEQLSLFGDGPAGAGDAAAATHAAARDAATAKGAAAPAPRGRETLVRATDKVKDRFGEDMLKYGRELRLGDHGTGTASKNPADYK